MNKNLIFFLGVLALFGLGKSVKKYVIPTKGIKYAPLFSQAENKYSLPKNLLARIAHQESYFDPTAFNPSGAMGMMQIIPRWHPEVKDPNDPKEAVPYAGKYMRQLYNMFGRWDYALAGYNWGPGNVKKWIESGADFNQLPEETQNYVKNITSDVGLV